MVGGLAPRQVPQAPRAGGRHPASLTDQWRRGEKFGETRRVLTAETVPGRLCDPGRVGSFVITIDYMKREPFLNQRSARSTGT